MKNQKFLTGFHIYYTNTNSYIQNFRWKGEQDTRNEGRGFFPSNTHNSKPVPSVDLLSPALTLPPPIQCTNCGSKVFHLSVKHTRRGPWCRPCWWAHLKKYEGMGQRTSYRDRGKRP